MSDRQLSLTPEGREVMRGQTLIPRLSRPVPPRPFSSFRDEDDTEDQRRGDSIVFTPVRHFYEHD